MNKQISELKKLAKKSRKRKTRVNKKRKPNSKLKKSPEIKKEEHKIGVQNAEHVINDRKLLQEYTKMSFALFLFVYRLFMIWIVIDPKAKQFRDGIITSGNVCKYHPKYVLLIGLVHLRTTHTQWEIAAQFYIDQSTVSRYSQYVNRFLVLFPTSPNSIARRIKDCATFREFQVWVQDRTIMFDGTHVKIHSPKDRKLNDKYKSGKKRMHTVNTLVVSTTERLIICISKTWPGSTHDMKILRNLKLDLGIWTRMMRDPNTRYYQRIVALLDAGFYGFKDLFPGMRIYLSKKKPINGQLTKTEKRYNRILSSLRSPAEHTIGAIKKFKRIIVPYAEDDENFNQKFVACSSLSNLIVLWDKNNDKPTARLQDLVERWAATVKQIAKKN